METRFFCRIGNAVYAHIDDDRPFFYHVRRYRIRTSCGSNQNIRAPRNFGKIFCTGVAERYRRVYVPP